MPVICNFDNIRIFSERILLRFKIKILWFKTAHAPVKNSFCSSLEQLLLQFKTAPAPV